LEDITDGIFESGSVERGLVSGLFDSDVPIHGVEMSEEVQVFDSSQ
jgi:hypothetical protein